MIGVFNLLFNDCLEPEILNGMKVFIKNGRAITENNTEGFVIRGVEVIKDGANAFYNPSTSFFKAACCDGTRHWAIFHGDKTVTLR